MVQLASGGEGGGRGGGKLGEAWREGFRGNYVSLVSVSGGSSRIIGRRAAAAAAPRGETARAGLI